MEFTELIKISRVDGVRLHRPFLPPAEMSLCITGHHLILSTSTTSEAAKPSNVEEILVRYRCFVMTILIVLTNFSA